MKPLSPMKQFLLLIATALALYASRPPDWLQLPGADEPRPANASQWILHESKTITQESATQFTMRVRRATMVLSDAAVQRMACYMTYTAGADELVSVRAWAMSPDGKKCRAFGGDEFLVYSPEINNLIWDQEKAVFMPAERYLQPGWIFAWEVVLRSSFAAFDSHWSPDSLYPVRSATFDVIPMTGGSIKWRGYPDSLAHPTVLDGGALRWTLANVPAEEPEVPDDMDRDEREVRVYVLPPGSAGADTKTWAEVVRLVRAQMEPQMTATPALAERAHRLVGTGSLWERIGPICRMAQADIAYLEVTIDTDSMAGYRPHPAGEVFDNLFGDCKDKAITLCTMLGVVGVPAHVMLVSAGEPRANTLDWPSAEFNHAIVAIPATEAPPAGWPVVRCDGVTYVLFDPTNERVPLGLLPTYDTGGVGLVLAPGVTTAVEIPMRAAASETGTTTVRIDLSANGSAKIAGTRELAGLAAAEAARLDATERRSDLSATLERRIQMRLPLMSGLTWQSSSDLAHYRWQSSVDFSAQYLGKLTAHGMFVPTDTLSDIPACAPWSEGARGWFTFAPRTLARHIELHLPAGFEVGELPSDWTLNTAAGTGSVRFHTEADGRVLGEVKLALQGGVLDHEHYVALRDLLHAATVAERRPIVLQKMAAPAPKK